MKKEPTENKDLVSRKEALKKMGKYAALTAMGRRKRRSNRKVKPKRKKQRCRERKQRLKSQRHL